jgi:hypothetical protein
MQLKVKREYKRLPLLYCNFANLNLLYYQVSNMQIIYTFKGIKDKFRRPRY